MTTAGTAPRWPTATNPATSDDEGVVGTGRVTSNVVVPQAKSDHPGLPIVIVAHSMGSFATQQFLLDHGTDVDAVALTGTAALDLLEPALDLSSDLDLSAFNAPFQPARTDFDWLSRDESVVDAYLADPLCGSRHRRRVGERHVRRCTPPRRPVRNGALAPLPALCI